MASGDKDTKTELLEDTAALLVKADELETEVGALRLFLWRALWGELDRPEEEVIDYFEKLGWLERIPSGFKATPAAPNGGE